ncbi:MAG: hypothetical protein LQ340_000758 [Diploschistes diacapsis]|nr:MAG: hypothetical protein LQ340_000758 [Diploschistes diacapsis]
MVEWYQMCQSDNGSLTAEHALRKWSVNYMRALEVLKDPRAPMQLQTLLREAGMANVETKMIPIPLCPWPRDARERQIGERIKAIVSDTLRSHALFAFTRNLVMPIREFDELISGASKEAVNPDLKAYFPL